VSVEAVTTRQGKLFQLINLPYFAISQVEKYIEWVTNQKNSALECDFGLVCVAARLFQ
jgi:hypothetical protein